MPLKIPTHPLHFLIPQGARTVPVSVIPGNQVKWHHGQKQGRAKRYVYHDTEGWVEHQGVVPMFGLRFLSEADLQLAHQFLWVLWHEDEIYGYVRLMKAETDQFLQQQPAFTTAVYPGSPGIPAGQVVTLTTGHVLLLNSHVENHLHGTLFTDHHSLALEEQAMAGFMKYVDENP
jgi:hypothetical protein